MIHRKIQAEVGQLVDLLLVRTLRPWSGNVGKRLVKAPKAYIRDSGLTHAIPRHRMLPHGQQCDGYAADRNDAGVGEIELNPIFLQIHIKISDIT